MTLAILGAGPAGVGAAYQAARRKLGRIVVIEQRHTPGGNAGSFDLAGVRVDYGSHRLHPSCDPRVLGDLKELVGDDLLRRPRHGRIRLRDRWIGFPLRPLDLALHLPPAFLFGAAADVIRKRFVPKPDTESFASVLEAGLGRTVCRDFYFPFARKLWGLDPHELSPVQARRRVSASTPAKMLRKTTSGRWFYYPRRGYGQIAEALSEAAKKHGAEFLFGTRVTGIDREGPRVTRVNYETGQSAGAVECDAVLSTLPINYLVRALDAPPEILEAADRMSFRAMILIYLVLDQDQFSEYDAHYFPEEAIPISRLSEPKNYAALAEPRGRTVLCAELPCDPASDYWKKTDGELGEIVAEALRAAGIPLRAPPAQIATRRLAQAYPIYRCGFEADFAALDDWLQRFTNLVTFGRQGLFAHDNAHHALHMAYCAVDCLNGEGSFDSARWQGFRRSFESHVVED
jgi:protoporphyrinogen oxidase